MNKYFYFTFLLVFPSFLFGQFTDEDTYWIATESRSVKGDAYMPQDGTILNFTKDSLYMHHVFHDSVRVYKFKVTPEKLRLRGERNPTIKHWTNDSLVLVYSNWMLVKYVPVSNGGFTNSDLEFWEYDHYTGKDTLWDYDLKLLDVPWVLYPDDNARKCIVEGGNRRFKYSELEKWSMLALDDNHIFSLTFGQFEPQIFKVLEYRNDTAFFELLGKEEYQGLYLAKQPRVSDEEFGAITKKLTTGRWKTKEVLDFAHSYNNDTILDGYEPVRTLREDTTIFTKSSLLEHQLSFDFSGDGVCKIYQSDVPVYKGKWELLPSGKEIALDEYNYIDIFSHDSNSMVIGKFDKFDVSNEEGREKGDYIIYYYRLKLGQ